MKTRKLYQIRANCTGLTMKLRSYKRARKLAAYLRSRYGINAYLAPLNVTVQAKKTCAGFDFTSRAQAGLGEVK